MSIRSFYSIVRYRQYVCDLIMRSRTMQCCKTRPLPLSHCLSATL